MQGLDLAKHWGWVSHECVKSESNEAARRSKQLQIPMTVPPLHPIIPCQDTLRLTSTYSLSRSLLHHATSASFENKTRCFIPGAPPSPRAASQAYEVRHHRNLALGTKSVGPGGPGAGKFYRGTVPSVSGEAHEKKTRLQEESLPSSTSQQKLPNA